LCAGDGCGQAEEFGEVGHRGVVLRVVASLINMGVCDKNRRLAC
jgi:hypothetical protein